MEILPNACIKPTAFISFLCTVITILKENGTLSSGRELITGIIGLVEVSILPKDAPVLNICSLKRLRAPSPWQFISHGFPLQCRHWKRYSSVTDSHFSEASAIKLDEMTLVKRLNARATHSSHQLHWSWAPPNKWVFKWCRRSIGGMSFLLGSEKTRADNTTGKPSTSLSGHVALTSGIRPNHKHSGHVDRWQFPSAVHWPCCTCTYSTFIYAESNKENLEFWMTYLQWPRKDIFLFSQLCNFFLKKRFHLSGNGSHLGENVLPFHQDEDACDVKTLVLPSVGRIMTNCHMLKSYRL